MKKFSVFIVFFVSCLYAFSIERVLQSYIFHDFTVFDRDDNVIEKIPSSDNNPLGMIVLAEIDNEKYIGITLGKETIYQIHVVLSKEVTENNIRSEIYGGAIYLQEKKAALQVFMFYTKTDTPDDIFIDIFNSPTLIKLGGLIKLKQ